MLNAADVLPGEVLLDPMCGTGMLLTEAPLHCHVLGRMLHADFGEFLEDVWGPKNGGVNVKCW